MGVVKALFQQTLLRDGYKHCSPPPANFMSVVLERYQLLNLERGWVLLVSLKDNFFYNFYYYFHSIFNNHTEDIFSMCKDVKKLPDQYRLKKAKLICFTSLLDLIRKKIELKEKL